MFNGKMKALTFSYDDGVLQDKRLVEILNKYNLKGTFNINSERFGEPGELWANHKTVLVDHSRLKAEDIKYVYDGHEVAAHTLKHTNLTTLTNDDEIAYNVEQDRLNLSELVDYEVVGLAYPGGYPNSNEHVAKVVKEKTNIKYARSVDTTKGFDPWPDLYQYRTTFEDCTSWDILFETGQKFLDLETDKPQIFFIWGHSYPFDAYPNRWEEFEEFCKMMSGKSDIFYGTNKEVLLSL